jgi:predicted lipoprotein with Yx(FWY)xxD motif
MITHLSRILTVTAIAVSAMIVPDCKKDTNDSTASGYAVSLRTSSIYGQYLVDKDGYTLYFFSNDYKGRTTCTGECAQLWPTFYVSDLTADKVGPGLDISDFDTVQLNGVPQLRYKSWPLYYYAPGVDPYEGNNIREPAGQITGDGYSEIWYVAKPDYSIMLENAQLVGADNKVYKGDYSQGTGTTIFFTDDKGRTLYTFSKDNLNQNKFTASDFSNNSIWTIYESAVNQIPSTLDKTLFNTIDVYGTTQLTYKGWPLYYYGGDNYVHGNTKGVSVPTPGVWPVAVRDLPAAPSGSNP